MDLQIWTFLIVGLTFALYIGIAIWSRAGSTSEFYVPEAGYPQWQTEWQPQPTG